MTGLPGPGQRWSLWAAGLYRDDVQQIIADGRVIRCDSAGLFVTLDRGDSGDEECP